MAIVGGCIHTQALTGMFLQSDTKTSPKTGPQNPSDVPKHLQTAPEISS
jgi:hypothetical protein